MSFEVTSVSRRRSLFIWGLCCALAGVVFVVYVLTSWTAGGAQVIMPLDDTYIHFQYARQLAALQPYVYNPGLPPTSGATSFLYPYVLAVGDWLGFDGLNLGLWAMAVGAVALALSAWLVFRLAAALGVRMWLAALIAALFASNGLLAWHFMSGMETGLTVLFTLLALYGLAARQPRWTIAGAALLALTRPEGSVLAVLVVVVQIFTPLLTPPRIQGGERRNPALFSLSPRLLANLFAWRGGWGGRGLLATSLPLLAIGVQPLVNWLVTGSVVASGNAAKSLFGIIPADMGVIVGRIADNFIRMWREFLDPGSFGAATVATSGVFALGLLALVGLVVLARKRPVFAALVIVWMVAGTLAVSTLDTAFWHFKRYQIPFIAAMFPLMAAAFEAGFRRIQRPALERVLAIILIVPTPITALLNLQLYAVNVGYVYAQPYQMARWLAANTPSDAVIAVHDVGMMRYVGGRTTLDMVGLTTPGAADYWRNGPGSTGEFLERMRPDYIASYGHGHGLGLGYLADTDLYAETLAEYTVSLTPNLNVALAAETQGIYAPDWANADRAAEPLTIPFVTRYLSGLERLSTLDAADIISERAHDYRWTITRPLGGFPTEYNKFGVIGCWWDACTVMDGARRLNGEESFTIPSAAGQDVVLVTRLHPASAGEFDVYANDVLIATRMIPALPGGWLEVPTLIPQAAANARIRIVPRGDGDYLPSMHWVYQGRYTPLANDSDAYATFQEGAIELRDPAISSSVLESGARQHEISWFWGTDGRARGDFKIFLHLLDENGNIAAQADVRPGLGALPPGNWLPGVFRDTITIDSTNLPPGRYRVMMGLYHPDTFERLAVTGGDEQNRLYIGDVVISGDG